MEYYRALETTYKKNCAGLENRLIGYNNSLILCWFQRFLIPACTKKDSTTLLFGNFRLKNNNCMYGFESRDKRQDVGIYLNLVVESVCFSFFVNQATKRHKVVV